MANFDVQIQSLAGTATQSEMDQWMTDGAKELINIFPNDLKEKCTNSTTLNATTTTLDLDGKGKILHVTRKNANSGYQIACREIPAMHSGSVDDSSSIHYVTATDPVYWVDSSSGVSTLNVKPTPTDSQTSIVYYIAYPVIDSSVVSTIANFPDEAEYLVVLYAACKVLQNKMNEKTGDLPNLVLPVLPTAPTMSEKSVTITGDAPVYVKPTIALDTKPTIADLSINAVAPIPPSTPSFTDIGAETIGDVTVDSTTINNLGVPPAYTAPTIGGQVEELTTTMDAGTATTEADQIDFSKWWEVLGDLIEDEEDSELAGLQVAKIQTYVQAYSQAVANKVNIFNKENAVYQTKLKEAIKQADINAQKAKKDAELSRDDAFQTANLTLQEENQEYAAKLGKYGADVSKYQAEVNKEVQEYQSNFKKDIELWKQNNSDKLQEYGQNIQNELNKFNDENTEYQTKLKKDLQDAQLAESKEGRDLQKYANQLSSYQAEVTAKVQDFQKALEKHSINYQWYQSQYAQLKQDYNQGIQMLVGGNAPQPQQKEQGER